MALGLCHGLGLDAGLRGRHADLLQKKEMVLNMGQSLMWRILLGLFLLALSPASPLLAAEPIATEEEAIAYPGLGEVVPRVTTLNEDAAAAELELQQLAETEAFAKTLRDLLDRHAELKQRIDSYGPVESWYFDRQLEVIGSLKALNKTFGQLQQEITAQLHSLDQIRSDWQARKNFWQQWEVQLKEAETKPPGDIFARAGDTTGQILGLVEKSGTALVELQKKVSDRQQEIQEQISQTEAALSKQRSILFQRNDHSLLSPAFWSQFTLELWQKAHQNIRASLRIQEDFFRRNALLLTLQILFALAAPLLIHRYRSAIGEESHWQIFTRHPLATGVFAAVAFLSFFYSETSPLIRLSLVTLGLCSAIYLLRGLVRSRQLRTALYAVTLLVLMTLAIRLTGLPLPYYRIYLLLLVLILLPLQWSLARYCRRTEQSGKIRAVLRLLGPLLLIALIANLSGHVALGQRLLESLLESVVVILFAILSYQLGLGGLSFLFSCATMRKNPIVYRFGRDFQRRCERWLLLLLFAYTVLYLTTTWGFYSSAGKAWQALTSFTITIADYPLSLEIVLLVILVFYLSLELSWLLQVTLDQQLFERRQYDRGVRDAVKKLLHYMLVLVGFLLAAGVAGFELQNLLVLAGAFGIGIGFGLQDIANNFLSGIILLFERPIKVGDGVLIDGDYGTVVRIGLRSTVVENLDQAELIVPNAQMISQKVTNWTLSTRRVRVVIPVGVAYGSDLELVLSLLRETGEQHPEVLEDPQPSPIFVQFGDSSLAFELRVWISDVDKRPRIKSELLLSIDKRFREAGVEIPFPQRDLHLRSVAAGILATPAPPEAQD
jgi:small-conductance mechanosensitive channel